VWTGRAKFDAFDPAGKWRIETTIIPSQSAMADLIARSYAIGG